MWSSVVSIHKLRSSPFSIRSSVYTPSPSPLPEPSSSTVVALPFMVPSVLRLCPSCVLSLGIRYTRLIQSPYTQSPYRAHSKPLRVNDTQDSAALFSIVSCHSQQDKIMYTSANFLLFPGHCAMAKGGSCSSPYLSVLH